MLRQVALAGTVLAMGMAAMAAETAPRKPKALLIMLDGWRADTLENACMPNLERLRKGTWQPGYNCAWSVTGLNLFDAITVSAPNHTAILTAVDAVKTRVFNNGQTKRGDYAHWPTWLTRVADARPEWKSLFIFSWGEGNAYAHTPKVQFIHDTDANNGVNLPKILAAADAPDAIQYFIDLPDHGGHGFGYYPYSSGYLNTVWESDRYIGACLDAIASRPTFAEEDWLIGVTADHGGYARSHGMWVGHATTVPLVISGRHLPAGRIPGTPRHYDVTATALRHFGIDPARAQLAGRAIESVAAKPKCRPLADGLVAYLPFSDKALVNEVKGGPQPKALGPRAVSGGRDGMFGGCLHLAGATNAVGGVKLEGSENLAFENGVEFAATVWVRLPAAQKGDPAIFSNKDWERGTNPGVVLTAARKGDGAKVPGVCFNAKVADKRVRIDLGTYDIEAGKWTFYAVTRDSEGTLSFWQGSPDGRLYRVVDHAEKLVLKALPFHIGQDGTGKYKYLLSGEVDDFALWTRALTPCEVRRIYESGRVGLELGDLLKHGRAAHQNENSDADAASFSF